MSSDSRKVTDWKEEKLTGTKPPLPSERVPPPSSTPPTSSSPSGRKRKAQIEEARLGRLGRALDGGLHTVGRPNQTPNQKQENSQFSFASEGTVSFELNISPSSSLSRPTNLLQMTLSSSHPPTQNNHLRIPSSPPSSARKKSDPRTDLKR